MWSPGPGELKALLCWPLGPGQGQPPPQCPQSHQNGPRVQVALLSRGTPSGLGEHIEAIPGLALLQRAQGAADTLCTQVCIQNTAQVTTDVGLTSGRTALLPSGLPLVGGSPGGQKGRERPQPPTLLQDKGKQ